MMTSVIQSVKTGDMAVSATVVTWAKLSSGDDTAWVLPFTLPQVCSAGLRPGRNTASWAGAAIKNRMDDSLPV